MTSSGCDWNTKPRFSYDIQEGTTDCWRRPGPNINPFICYTCSCVTFQGSAPSRKNLIPCLQFLFSKVKWKKKSFIKYGWNENVKWIVKTKKKSHFERQCVCGYVCLNVCACVSSCVCMCLCLRMHVFVILCVCHGRGEYKYWIYSHL